jgi:hypothetical protein
MSLCPFVLFLLLSVLSLTCRTHVSGYLQPPAVHPPSHTRNRRSPPSPVPTLAIIAPRLPLCRPCPPPSPVFLGSVFGIFRFGFRFFVPSLTLATVMKQGGEASGIGWRREVEGGGGVGSSTGRGGLQLTLAGAGRPSHRSSPAAISPEEEERNTREEEERQGHAESFYPPRCPPSNMACFAGVPSRQKW